LAKGFYRKLAWNNLRRSKEVYLPYMIATAIISGVFFLTVGLTFSGKLSNIPSGQITKSVFAMGIGLFAVFAVGFMAYINNFLVKRRKKEFGLYSVLGLSKGHIGRVLLWENSMVLGIGVAAGMVFTLVFGRLLFLLLLKVIHVAPDSEFSIPPMAYAVTVVLFFIVFLLTSAYNLLQIRISNPIELMHSEKTGDKKDSRFLLPRAILGFVLLAAAYYCAWTIDVSGTALGAFFPLALLVILATGLLFTSGSIAVLRLLRANKQIYYKLKNFVSISGMFHRMKQNAAGLAAICILSTMLIVTVSGTLALYLGQEEILEESYPLYDVMVYVDKSDLKDDAAVEDSGRRFDEVIGKLAAHYGVQTDIDSLPVEKSSGKAEWSDEKKKTFYFNDLKRFTHCVYAGGNFIFNLNCGQTEGYAFTEALHEQIASGAFDGSVWGIDSVFTARQDGYAIYGGLLFLGVFFGILFLAVTVLIIYFKQVTEGYEDKERFEILQKVGMDEEQVKSTINRQILWVFFLPLGMTFLHMIFASKIMARMIESFLVYNWTVTIACVAGVCGVFALLYLWVYRMTAKMYFRIVKW